MRREKNLQNHFIILYLLKCRVIMTCDYKRLIKPYGCNMDLVNPVIMVGLINLKMEFTTFYEDFYQGLWLIFVN